jgi:hypothetical protein
MAEIINLRRARKAKARQGAADTAANNRLRFGRTKAERMNEGITAVLDGARREPE